MQIQEFGLDLEGLDSGLSFEGGTWCWPSCRLVLHVCFAEATEAPAPLLLM